MMLLPRGATIQCHDGAAGKLKYVVIDPDDGDVTHLIVGRGKLLRRDIVVPAGWVEGETRGEVLLNATAEDLNNLPEYKEFDFIAPDPSYRPVGGHPVEGTRFWVGPYNLVGGGRPWILRHVRMGIQDDEVVLRRGLRVHTRDGSTVGTLDHLVVEPTSRQVTHFVVRRGSILDLKAHIVPLERVTAITEYGLRLNMTVDELAQAPLYQAPATDEQIAVALQRALETDPRTRTAGLRVDVQGGVVRFVGTVTDTVVDAAKSIARRMRGVIGFADDAVAPPSPPLRIGEPVYARDGRYGTLDKVVIDPYARRVTHLVVRKGWLLAEDRVIPIERLEYAELDGIYLDATSAELGQFPRYREEVFVEPLPGWEALAPYAAANTLFWGAPYIGVAPPIIPVIEHRVPVDMPEDEIVLRRGADIFYNDEVVGSLDHVLIDPTSGTVTHLVVEEHKRGRGVIVPVDWVRELDAEAISLNRWDPVQPGVPAYDVTRNDAEISAQLSAGLHATPRYQNVQVQVDHRWVFLSGYVSTTADKMAMEDIARSIPGVIHVSNAITADTELVGQIMTELAADQQMAPFPIEVIADHGVVTLRGAVPTPEIKTMADAIVRRVPKVRVVVNELEIRHEEIYD